MHAASFYQCSFTELRFQPRQQCELLLGRINNANYMFQLPQLIEERLIAITTMKLILRPMPRNLHFSQRQSHPL